MATFSRLLKNRSLVTIGISESVSNIGNWITMMAVFAMVVFKGQGTVAESGGIFLSGLLPTLLFSPVAGWLCDRFDRKRLMIFSELLSGAVICGLVFVTRLEWIYALLALQAVTTAIMTPARQAVMPDVVDREALTQANAFLQQLAGIIKIGAPLLAGLVLTILNPHQAILLDVVSFALSALILSRLPALPPHPAAPVQPSPTVSETGHDASRPSGLRAALKEAPGLQLLFAASFLVIMVVVGFDVLSSVFTRDVLQGTESLYGLMVGLVGMGTLAAAILLMVRKGAANPWRDLMAGILLLALIPGSLALACRLPGTGFGRWVVFLGVLLGGGGNGLVIIQSGTLIQLLAPRSLLGRMAGVFQSTAVAGQLIGIVATPLLVPARMSMGAYFSAAGVALLFLAVAVAFVVHPTRAGLRAPMAE